MLVRAADEEGQEGITNGKIKVIGAFLLVTESTYLGNRLPGAWNVDAGKQKGRDEVRC